LIVAGEFPLIIGHSIVQPYSLQVWYPQRIGHGEAYEPGIGSPAAGLPNQIDVPINMEAATREKKRVYGIHFKQT